MLKVLCGTIDAKYVLLSVLAYTYKRRLSLHIMICKQVVLFLNWLLPALFMTLCTSAHFAFGYRQDPWCVNDADTLQDSVGQMHTLESEKNSCKFSIFQTDITWEKPIHRCPLKGMQSAEPNNDA